MITSRKKTKKYSPRKVSRVELAAFLRRLAATYHNSRTGNIGLAEALYELADTVALQPYAVVGHSYQSPELPFSRASITARHLLDPQALQRLDAEAVAKILADGSKTKVELIELAAARFSIPRSRLMRMKTEDVREAIQTALLHEDSISIIAQEARRSGADRKS